MLHSYGGCRNPSPTTKAHTMQFSGTHTWRALLAATLITSGGIFGSDFPFSTVQAADTKPTGADVAFPSTTSPQIELTNARLAVISDKLSQLLIDNAGPTLAGAEKHTASPLMAHYEILHSNSIMGLSTVNSNALIDEDLPLFYRSGGYMGHSLMDKGGSLSRTSDLVEQLQLKLIRRTATGYALSMAYMITNPSHDTNGNLEKGVLLSQYLDQSIFLEGCTSHSTCQTRIHLGNTGAELLLDIRASASKPPESQSPSVH